MHCCHPHRQVCPVIGLLSAEGTPVCHLLCADFNGTVVAATLAAGSLMAYTYAWPNLARVLRSALPWKLCVFSVLCCACLVLASMSLHLPVSREQAAGVALSAQLVYFGVFSLANALYYDVTGQCVQKAADAVAAQARWSGQDDSGTVDMADSAVPPFFIVFVLNSCASVAIQSISTFIVFQWAKMEVLSAFFVFGCVVAGGVLVPPLTWSLGQLGCLHAIRVNPEAVYRPTHLQDYTD